MLDINVNLKAYDMVMKKLLDRMNDGIRDMRDIEARVIMKNKEKEDIIKKEAAEKAKAERRAKRKAKEEKKKKEDKN